jgi:hypothetical protein
MSNTLYFYPILARLGLVMVVVAVVREARGSNMDPNDMPPIFVPLYLLAGL